MTAHPLLEEDRRALRWHRIRGFAPFFLGLFSLIVSLLGVLARIEDFAPLRRFGRSVLSSIPPGGSFYREHFYFTFDKPPFATVATLAGLVLLIWGAIELRAAAQLKHELRTVEDARRQQQLLRELEDEQARSAK